MSWAICVNQAIEELLIACTLFVMKLTAHRLSHRLATSHAGPSFICFVVLSLSFKMSDLWSWPVVCFYVRGDVIWKEDSVANAIWEQYSHHAAAYRVLPSRYYWRRFWYVVLHDLNFQ
jgi:hypothetical protein